jgi:DNA-binding NarL/FixJ family response regulator
LLQQICPQVKVVILTRHAETGYVRQLLRAGASGYVLKQSRSTDLLHGIRAAASGGTYVDPAMVGGLVMNYGKPQERGLAGDHTSNLTLRETEVLRLMASGHSNKEIAARLGIGVKTVESHKTHAMQKLGMRTRIDVVRFALLHGWLNDA